MKLRYKLDDFKKLFKARVFGKVVFLTLINGRGAPFIDRCVGEVNNKQSWRGYAIQLNPFNFGLDGLRKEGKCFVVGLISS